MNKWWEEETEDNKKARELAKLVVIVPKSNTYLSDKIQGIFDREMENRDFKEDGEWEFAIKKVSISICQSGLLNAHDIVSDWAKNWDKEFGLIADKRTPEYKADIEKFGKPIWKRALEFELWDIFTHDGNYTLSDAVHECTNSMWAEQCDPFDMTAMFNAAVHEVLDKVLLDNPDELDANAFDKYSIYK
ncbi:MAG: hypothetical protein QM504_08470 [Pseudomonadota bacterium]